MRIRIAVIYSFWFTAMLFQIFQSLVICLKDSGLRTGRGFGGIAAPANEQLTAAGFARVSRPAQLFSDFITR